MINKTFFLHALFALAPILSLTGGQTAGTIADGKAVEEFTGAHTRVVWLVDEFNHDTFGRNDNMRLKAYDSRDGRGERIIVDEKGNYATPLITPDGQRIVFSNRKENKIYLVNWDGTGRRFLKDGGASEVWSDPDTGKTWVYAQRENSGFDSPVIRFLLDDPATEEVIWDASPIQVLSAGAFQVSRDGKRAAATFPWPASGIAELPNVAWRKQRDGCWPSMAPDDSYMSWTFDGAHKNLYLMRPGAGKAWKVNVSAAPGVNDHELYHPRWTNHVGYMVMTGPYKKGLWEKVDHVEIYLGKFNDDFTAVSDWLKLTNSVEGQTFPDVWIAGGENARSKFHGQTVATEKPKTNFFDIASWFKKKPAFSEAWPVSTQGLVFLWENNQGSNQFKNNQGQSRSARLAVSGGSRWGPNGDMHIVHGTFSPEQTFANEIREACMKTNQLAIEAIITTARSPQNGPARIISFSKNISRRNFTLAQQDDSLVLRLQTSETDKNGVDFKLAPLEPGQPHHVLVTYQPGKLICYVDGVVASDTEFETGTFEDWKEYSLLFGNEQSGGDRYWEGFLEAVAIYNRFVKPEEAKRKYEAAQEIIARRQNIATTVVKAEMLSKDAPPPPEAIAPYRRALVVNHYKIQEASDAAQVGQTVQVAEWALLDAAVPATYEQAQIGVVRTLELQPYESHPQLESERMVSETPSLDEALFYDVASGQ